jgi:rhodanese-related sulfurtransferase
LSATGFKATAIEMMPQDLAALRDAGTAHTVLDVREPWETALCLIPGSLTVPLGSLPTQLARLPSDQPLVVVCHHGGRSMQAVNWLRGQGYENAINLRGGVDAWARQVDPTMTTY